MKRVLVTGGAGFVGSNLIKLLRERYPDLTIVSLDNYFTGKKENHVEGVQYIDGNTWEAGEIFSNLKEEDYFDVVFHFGEFSRIVQSFDNIKHVYDSIFRGTPTILELCRTWKAKLVYSASSSKFGNEGKDENLSPYSWAKAKIVELIKNYRAWYGLNYEICYFFNVYGPNQIMEGEYATVVGIFERQYKNGDKCSVVAPGTQTRDFTHIGDIVTGIDATLGQNLNHEWHLRSGKNVSIIELAEMFGEWVIIPERRGERFSSEEFESDTEDLLGWKSTHQLVDWVNSVK